MLSKGVNFPVGTIRSAPRLARFPTGTTLLTGTSTDCC